MKKNVLMVYIVTISLIFNGCNESQKRNWTETEKQQFRDEVSTVKDLSNFGENKSKWIECFLSKCEAKYSSIYEANQDEKGCEKIALECNNEVLADGSQKGNWTETDKQQFRYVMSTVKDLSNFGENKSKWIECFLSKCEAKYSSIYEANQDEKGCEKIALECNNEVLSNQ